MYVNYVKLSRAIRKALTLALNPTLTRDQARTRALFDDNAEASALFDDAELGITPDANDFRLSDADWREQYARAMLAELVGK